MERNGFSNISKHNNIGGTISNIKDKKVNINLNRDHSWDSISESVGGGGGGDFLGGFPWPPRSYTCSFCKREFRSAQALGGHMNVHRRDRARMRQSPPRDHAHNSMLNLNLHPNPNPNPNFSSSSPSSSSSSPSRLPPLPPLVSPSLSSPSPSGIKKWGGADLGKMKTAKTLFGVGEFEGLGHEEKEGVVLKKEEIVRLELEIGMHRDAEDDLDLELRLGYS